MLINTMIQTGMHSVKECVMLDANLVSYDMAHRAFCADHRIKVVL